MSSTSAITNLQQVLQIEKEEEKNIFLKQLTKSSISERVKQGITWFPLRLSNVEYGLGEYLIFEFERDKKQQDVSFFQIGKTVEIFSENGKDKKSLKGVIKSMLRNRVVVSTTCDEMPDWLDDDTTGLNMVYDEFSFREMEFAIKRLLDTTDKNIANLRDIVYEDKQFSFENEYNVQISTLNSIQNKAVNLCLNAKDFAIVHGPPGTGKTTTIIEFICEAIKHEKQILVCSPSNLAVDLLAEKLLFRGINVLRMGNPTRISDEILSITLDGQLMAHNSYKELKNYRKQAEDYRVLARKYKRNFGPQERNQRQLLFQESKSLLNEAREIEEFIVQQSINKAQVICATLVGASNQYLHNKKFKTLVIDEAAQALEPACWIPIHKAQRVILAGDHLQLPPTVKSKIAEAGGLGITLMEKLMQRKGISVTLETQYRMNEQIMEFPSNKVYNGVLKAHESVASSYLLNGNSLNFVWPPLEFIDTAGCGFDEFMHPETKSVNNPEEAALLLDHLAGLLLSLQKERSKFPDYSVGIISPYSQQVQVLNALIEEHPILKDFKNIRVKTIDGFQGREKDIIYLSLVRSNPQAEIGFLQDIRRMNVALTRAKYKLVVVGDSATICSHPFYEAFVDYCQNKGINKSAWEFMHLKDNH